MKIHILSDLHFEFGKWPKHIDVNAIDADVTVLAGDIGVGLAGIQWALRFNRPVVPVLGNHEFYGQRPMLELMRKVREKTENTHVHVLDNESLVLADPRVPGRNIRFLGATLWTDFSILGADRQQECMDSAARYMSDYSSIYFSKRGKALVESGLYTGHQGDRLTPQKTLSMHYDSRSFLEQELAKVSDGSSKTQNKTVVVTHHAPSAKSLANQEAGTHMDAAYASNLENLVERADLWIHGHTHVVSDYRIGAGRVVTNPRGYAGAGLVSDFEPNLVVEV